MTTAMQIGETARDRPDFCRFFKTGAAVFLHDDGIVAHSTYRNTLRAAYMLARTNGDTHGCTLADAWILLWFDVRPSFNSGHSSWRRSCPLCATTGLM